jgi:hypothetical protein
LCIALDVGETDQNDSFAPAAFHFDPLRCHLGQQAAALAAVLLDRGDAERADHGEGSLILILRLIINILKGAHLSSEK